VFAALEQRSQSKNLQRFQTNQYLLMDAINHADQMRLANLINDNSDDAEIQRKLDQVLELTSSTRDQAAVALHDCHYDVGKAVDMILEGDQSIVENQWRSAGKKKNKNNASSQASKSGTQSTGHAGGTNKFSGPSSGKGHHHSTSVAPTGHHSGASNARSAAAASNDGSVSRDQQTKGNQMSAAPQINSSNNMNTSNSQSSNKHDASDNLQDIAGIASSNLIDTSDLATTSLSTTTSTVTTTKAPPLLHQPQHQQSQHLQQYKHQQPRQKGTMQISSRQHHQRSTRIPDSAVEMPNNELQMSSLNVQFGELELKDSAVGASDNKGTFQDVLEPNRIGRQVGNPSSHPPQQDLKANRQVSQQYNARGAPRRAYNNTGDDKKFYGNSGRGGRQASGSQRPFNQRSGQPNQNNTRGGGVRTILNRGLQQNSNLSSSSSNQQSSGFPNSIDTWTNSTAEAASKASQDQTSISNVASTLRVGQWSDVAGNEDWSEEEHWDAKVMETKVFTPSSKAVDSPAPGSKNQLITDGSVPSQINLASKLSSAARDDVNPQANPLKTVAQPVQSQQPSQKQLSHMNDIFDPSVAKAVLEQQNLAAIKPKTSIGIAQYTKEASEPKNVLDSQNLSSIKPKSTISMNQYNKEASESLKSLVGISSASAGSGAANNNTNKGGVPSVPPGALPLMSQPQYIMGNAYHQPAIFPYPYQAPDVHYPVAAPTTGRDQNFHSVYSPNDGNKFSRGTDGDAPSITTTQTAPVASQTHNQAFVANALHAGYQLTYAMPGTFNMMPQNLYSAAPIFPHIPQPTNTGSANTVYQKSTPASYQHHTGYSSYDQLNQSLIQDYVKQPQNYSGSMQQQQPTTKSSGAGNELDVSSGANSYNMYGSVNKGQAQQSKQACYNDAKGFQQQMSNNAPHQQFGFSHSTQQPSSLTGGYPLLQPHGLENNDLTGQAGSAQSQLHPTGQRGGSQVNPAKYYNWN